jgi:hypothetical protein
MPPHCDTRDGPVVTAARRALESGNVNLVLIWVSHAAEPELRAAFDRVMRARTAGREAQEVADDWFFETVVRLHRAGEGEGFTGLKPAGLSEGPVVPRADEAIRTGNPGEVIRFIADALEEDLLRRFRRVMEAKRYDPDDVPAGREYVQAYIGFVVHAHHLHEGIAGSEVHGGGAGVHHH